MKAEKGNKVYTIDESSKRMYQEEGFDILDDSGDVILYGRGKTVSLEDYMAAVKEIERLQAMFKMAPEKQESEAEKKTTKKQGPEKEI